MLARVKWAGIFGTEQEFDRKRHHPTQKPVKLVEWFFDYYSMKDKIIIADIYGGAGGTLIACEKTNRICRMMELDPKYCDVIVQRWQEFTGKIATNAETGQPFAEVSNGN
jgi:DNA modification methylase